MDESSYTARESHGGFGPWVDHLAYGHIYRDDHHGTKRVSMSTFVTDGRFEAVLFDMDGVITDTASLHARCWKTMFDEYLEKRSRRNAEPFRAFDLDADYKLHVDGKPRYLGVRDFLKSRGIVLPEGTPEDSTADETVCGLGNRKNELFNNQLASTGVEAYAGSVAFLEYLRRMGIKSFRI